MKDYLAAADGVVNALIASEVALYEAHVVSEGPEVLAVARGEVVKHGYFLASGEELRHEIGADEARTAGDKDAHGPTLTDLG
jgi:hypothetical protein